MHPAEAPASMASGSFTISSRRLEKGILIEPTGEIDLATASIVEDELRRAEESEDLIVLDAGGVSFIDSTGIRVILGVDQRMRARGASLQVLNVPSQMHKLFRLVGISQHLGLDGATGDGRPG